MAVTTFDDLIAAPTSQKIFLVEVEPSQQLTEWTLYSGSVYYQVVGSPLHVLSVEEDGTALTEVSALGSVGAGDWYYDGGTGRLYVQPTSGSIYSKVIVADYKLYYSNDTKAGGAGVIFNGHLYEPLVLAVPSIRQQKADLFWGISIVADGQLSLMNHDGYFDDWYNDLAWNNKPIKVLLGGEDLPYSEYKAMFTGVVFNKHLSTDVLELSFVDKKYDLSDTLPENTFSTTDWPNIEAEIVGQPVPLVFGTVYRIKAVCVTGGLGTATSLHTFKFADTSLGSVQEISQIYVNDVAVNHSSADLAAATFRLATSVFSVGDEVTLDAKGYLSGTTLVENPIDVLKKLLAIKDFSYTSSTFNLTSFSQARSDADGFPIGLWIGDYKALIDIIGDIMKSCLGVLYLDNDGLFSVTIWDTDLPDDPDEVDELDILPRTFKAQAKNDDIRKVVRVGWRKNWAAESYAYKQDTSDTTERVYGVKRSRTVQTLQSSEAGVETYLARMKIMYEAATTRVQFTSKMVLAKKNVGDRFELSFKRRATDSDIGWLSGRMLEMLSIEKDFTHNTLHILADDLKGIGGSIGHWTDNPPVFPTSLGGEVMSPWDSEWSAAKKAYAKNHAGFFCDNNGFADPADSDSRDISRWW